MCTMKLYTKIGLMLTIAMLIIVTAQAQDFVLKAAKASIQGTSSLHDWESTISQLDCKITFAIENNVLKTIKSAEVSIPVVGIKSTKGKMMDNKTYDAFLYEKNPTITFLLVTSQLRPEGPGQALDASGYLTIAGTMKSVKLSGLAKVLPSGDVQLTLTKKIKMTDFKMEPPTAIMGTITVGDEVTLNFDLTLTPSTATPQAKK
jgi:polyisoprenoid-binding protein YceI